MDDSPHPQPPSKMTTTIPPELDDQLKNILERYVATKKQAEEVRKELCLYICFRMLTEEANFETEDSAHSAFALHYHNLLITYYQKIIYPQETDNLSKNKRGYLLKIIKERIWSTIWTIHTSPEVS